MKTRKRIVKEGFYKGEIAARSMDKLASIEGDLVSICNDIKLVFGKDSDVFARVDLLRTDCGEALDLLDNALKGMKYKVDESEEDDTSKSTLGEIKRKIEFLTDATSPESVLDRMLEDPPEYKDMRNCVYEIYKLAHEALDGEVKTPVFESNDGSAWFDERGDMLKTLPGDCILACSGQGRVDDDVAFWVDELGFDIDLPRERTINYLREYGAWEPDELENMDIIELAEKVLWIFCNDLKEQAYDMVGEDEELAAKLGDDPSAWGDKEWEQFQNEYGYCTLSN